MGEDAAMHCIVEVGDPAFSSSGACLRPFLRPQSTVTGGNQAGEVNSWSVSHLLMQFTCLSGPARDCSSIYAFKKLFYILCCSEQPITEFVVSSHIHFMVDSLDLTML
jgi:hypothetical protein